MKKRRRGSERLTYFQRMDIWWSRRRIPLSTSTPRSTKKKDKNKRGGGEGGVKRADKRKQGRKER